MIDAAKYADLVLLMIDGGFGFEMETFEFLNILQASNCLWQCPEWSAGCLLGIQQCLACQQSLIFLAGLPVGPQGVHANWAVDCICDKQYRQSFILFQLFPWAASTGHVLPALHRMFAQCRWEPCCSRCLACRPSAPRSDTHILVCSWVP